MFKVRSRSTVVTGGAGYIGSVVARRLLAGGRRVVVVDRLDFGSAALEGLIGHPGFELIVADFRDQDILRRLCRDAEAVVHLGAIVGDAACQLDEQEAISVNRDASRQVAETCRRAGVPRFVFASTCSVYGASDDVVNETSSLNPVSLYARTKIESENLLLSIRDERFHPTILRLGTAFGWSPRPRFDLVVNLLTARAHFEGRAVIYNGSQWRPFVHVDDIARAFARTLDAPVVKTTGEVFNVGSNRMNRRLSDLGRVLQRRFPDARVLEEFTNDRRNYRVSFDKIVDRLGFRSRTSLTRGIDEMRQALMQGATADYRAAEYHNHLAARAAV